MPVLLPMSDSRARTGKARPAKAAHHAVVIAGGGPTGLMLAPELALANSDVAILERRASQDLTGTRAGGLHARSIEILAQRGVADRFLREGKVTQLAGFAWTRLDISDLPTRYAHGLALRQSHIERILADWVKELAVPVYRGRGVTDVVQDETGVDIALAGGETLRRLPRRLRRRPQPVAQDGRPRICRHRPDAQQPHGRSRDARGAAMGAASGCAWLSRPQQNGERARAGRHDGSDARAHRRTDFKRSQRYADRRVRHRLRRS